MKWDKEGDENARYYPATLTSIKYNCETATAPCANQALDQQEQVARGEGAMDRGLKELGSRQGADQEQPDEPEREGRAGGTAAACRSTAWCCAPAGRGCRPGSVP